jgi:hypothetical protein
MAKQREPDSIKVSQMMDVENLEPIESCDGMLVFPIYDISQN